MQQCMTSFYDVTGFELLVTNTNYGVLTGRIKQKTTSTICYPRFKVTTFVSLITFILQLGLRYPTSFSSP